MISAQELRLGNWFKWSELSSIGIGYDFIRYGAAIDAYNSLKDPIPLTTEILIAAGFKAMGHFTVGGVMTMDVGRKRFLSISNIGTPNEFLYLEYVDNKTVTDLVCIHNYDYDGLLYLHKLQNIIYFLTGNEIEIKL